MCATAEKSSTTRSEPSSGTLLQPLTFSNNEKNPDGSEKEISYGEYVNKINKRALKEQRRIMRKKIKRQINDEDVKESEPSDDDK